MSLLSFFQKAPANNNKWLHYSRPSNTKTDNKTTGGLPISILKPCFISKELWKFNPAKISTHTIMKSPKYVYHVNCITMVSDHNTFKCNYPTIHKQMQSSASRTNLFKSALEKEINITYSNIHFKLNSTRTHSFMHANILHRLAQR